MRNRSQNEITFMVFALVVDESGITAEQIARVLFLTSEDVASVLEHYTDYGIIYSGERGKLYPTEKGKSVWFQIQSE